MLGRGSDDLRIPESLGGLKNRMPVSACPRRFIGDASAVASCVGCLVGACVGCLYPLACLPACRRGCLPACLPASDLGGSALASLVGTPDRKKRNIGCFFFPVAFSPLLIASEEKSMIFLPCFFGWGVLVSRCGVVRLVKPSTPQTRQKRLFFLAWLPIKIK